MEHHLDSQALKKETEEKKPVIVLNSFMLEYPNILHLERIKTLNRTLSSKSAKAMVLFLKCLHTTAIRSSLFPSIKYPQSKQSICQELESE